MFLGMGLASVDRLRIIPISFVLYFVFKRMQPFAGRELLMVAGYQSCLVVIKVYLALMHPDFYQAGRIWEPLLVSCVAVLLVFKPRRELAWALIVYYGLSVFILLYLLLFHRRADPVKQQAWFLCSIVDVLLVSLLVKWVVKQPAISPNPDSLVSDDKTSV